MKSRTRTNKTRVLIAFGKGIAGTLALELAMLFAHGGSEVRAALIDNSGDWVAEAPLKQICGHSPFTATHQPGWFFAGLQYDAAVVVAPSTLFQQQLLSGVTADPLVDYILGSCRQISILQNRQQIPTESDNFGRFVISELPAQQMKLPQFFQKTFADLTARMAARALNRRRSASIIYAVPEALRHVTGPCPAWLHRLRNALEKGNISLSKASGQVDIAISAYDGPGIDLDGRLCPSATELEENAGLRVVFVGPETPAKPDSRHIFIRRLPNGLTVIDRHGTRLIPDVTGQCCFSRLAEYLLNCLAREEKP